MQDVNERMSAYLKKNRVSGLALGKKLGIAHQTISLYLNGNTKMPLKFLLAFLQAFPDVSAEWLLRGKETKLENAQPSLVERIPLIPLSAFGGPNTEFNDMGIMLRDCEMIENPVEGAEYAIKVKGDSMSPMYRPMGTLFIKRIDQTLFIEWGCCYVLATANGTIVKKLMPKNEKELTCVSINSQYPPFDIRKSDIHAVFKILACLNYE